MADLVNDSHLFDVSAFGVLVNHLELVRRSLNTGRELLTLSLAIEGGLHEEVPATRFDVHILSLLLPPTWSSSGDLLHAWHGQPG